MKVKEITPDAHMCAIGLCPSVYRTDHGTLLIVGKSRKPSECSAELEGKVGPDEEMVEVPIGIIRDLALNSLD